MQPLLCFIMKLGQRLAYWKGMRWQLEFYFCLLLRWACTPFRIYNNKLYRLALTHITNINQFLHFQLVIELNFTEKFVYLCSNIHVPKLYSILQAKVRLLTGDPFLFSNPGARFFNMKSLKKCGNCEPFPYAQ